MWRAWIGFNFSHSLGVLLVAGLALWAGFRFNTLPVGIIMPALTLIGCVYLVLALLYWFSCSRHRRCRWHRLLRRRMGSVTKVTRRQPADLNVKLKPINLHTASSA